MKKDNATAHKCSVCGYALQPFHPEEPLSWQRCSRKLCGHIQREPAPAGTNSESPLFTDMAPAPAPASLWEKLRDTFDSASQSDSKDRELWDRLYLPETPGTLLELGSGDPARIMKATALGWTAESWHLSSRAPQQWQDKGLKLKSGEPDWNSCSPESFDAVVIRWALEQSADPIALLRNAWRILKPSGRLVIIAWNSHSLGNELYGARWMPLSIGQHRQLYSPGSLRRSVALAEIGVKFVLFTSFAGQLPQSLPAQPQSEMDTLRQKALKQLREDPLCGEALVLISEKQK